MHGPTAAIESNLLINGNWSATGNPYVPDLSETHLDYWNGFNINSNSDAHPALPVGTMLGTGNFRILTAYLSRADGAIFELDAQEIPASPDFEHSGYDYYYVHDIEWHLLEPDLSNIDIIKQKIMIHGAVASAIHWDEALIYGYNHYQPDYDSRNPNHAIAIVGWDDNRATQAPLPGAWLCKNSYGTGWRDHGFFWVSYYDKNCCRHPETGAYSFIGTEYVPYGCFYNYCYFHDLHGWRDTKTDCSEAFNTFVPPRDQELRSVSFFTAADSVTYTVKIFDTFESGSLLGELASQTGFIEHPGFHTINLETPITLLTGNDFHIYLNLSTGGHPYDCTSQLALVLAGPGTGMELPSKAEAGQSYFYNGSEWQDLYEIDTTANFCIKGLAFELAPLPVNIVSILDGGDGQSLMARIAQQNPDVVDHITVFREELNTGQLDYISLSANETDALFNGLTEGWEYRFFAVATDKHDRSSRDYDYAFGIPHSLPRQPEQLTAYTIHNAIKLIWTEKNTELDFSHYTIMRDGSPLPGLISDTVFIDDDPSLGTDYHSYLVIAVDNDGNTSDTAGIEPDSMRAASLQSGEILAINRSGNSHIAMVDETVTGEFMREALEGMSYTYFSDTAASAPERASLMNLIDYCLIIVGAESGRQDDIGNKPEYGGILEDIGYYLSIGGKAIIFGRWGDIAIDRISVDTVGYPPGSIGSGYNEYFDISYRIVPRTYINAVDVALESDLIGAHSLMGGYPDLSWDSLATSNHSGALGNVSGIPCPTYSILSGSDYEIIYTYNSAVDSSLTEGMPIAWRNTGGPYDYVFLDIPLSFMERGEAITALRQAIGDLGIISDVDDENSAASLPRDFALAQNYPNPFNPTTVIEFFNPGRRAMVSLDIFNILGQRVITLFNDAADPGWNHIEWDGRNQSGQRVASGVYFYRLKAGQSSLTRKMVLLK